MRRGSILIEGILGISLLVPAIALCVELIRASWIHAALQAGCFEYTRHRFLGWSESEARLGLERSFSRWHPHPARLLRGIETGTDRFAAGFSGWVQWRYPSLLPSLQTRHQVTKRCFYSFSP